VSNPSVGGNGVDRDMGTSSSASAMRVLGAIEGDSPLQEKGWESNGAVIWKLLVRGGVSEVLGQEGGSGGSRPLVRGQVNLPVHNTSFPRGRGGRGGRSLQEAEEGRLYEEL